MVKSEIETIVLDVAEKVLTERGIADAPNLDKPLTEVGIGLDSIGRLSLLTEIEEKTDIEFPEEYWGSKTFENLSKIVHFINDQKNN